jgi:hypothetical protein
LPGVAGAAWKVVYFASIFMNSIAASTSSRIQSTALG